MRNIPQAVRDRALSAGEIGVKWLNNLGAMIAELEQRWQIRVGDALSGGTSAFAAFADGANGEAYVLRIDMPASGDEDMFRQNLEVLKIANGIGYADLIACDVGKRAMLLERLGRPLADMGYSIRKQIRIICETLMKTWAIPLENPALPDGGESIGWFKGFIPAEYERRGKPCPQKVIDQAVRFLEAREAAKNPAEYVLVHGDAHATNTLQAKDGGFKLIDADGAYYEKGSDLGVLMREWREEYVGDIRAVGEARCDWICEITGADRDSVWQWGYIQCVSTRHGANNGVWDCRRGCGGPFFCARI